MTETKKITHWLWLLFGIQLLSTALSVLSQLSVVMPMGFLGQWVSPVQQALSLMTVICLFLLPWYYRLSAICKAVWLIVSLHPYWLNYLLPPLSVELYLMVTGILKWIGMVLSVAALYLECTCHGSTAPALKKQWMLVFTISFAVTLLSPLSVILLQGVINRMLLSGNTLGMLIVNLISLCVGLAVSVFYLWTLYKTLAVQKKEETRYGC